MGFSELFVFASFRKVRLSKFGNFLEKTIIFAKNFGKKFGNLSSEKKFGYYSKMYVNFENFEKSK